MAKVLIKVIVGSPSGILRYSGKLRGIRRSLSNPWQCKAWKPYYVPLGPWTVGAFEGDLLALLDLDHDGAEQVPVGLGVEPPADLDETEDDLGDAGVEGVLIHGGHPFRREPRRRRAAPWKPQ